MLIDTLAAVINLPKEKVVFWSTCSPQELVTDMDYIDLIFTLDKSLLEHTLHHARAAYEEMLPYFQQQLNVRYGIKEAPMFSQTMANWILSIVEYPQYIQKLIQFHHNIPVEAIMGGLPMMLEMLSHLKEGHEEWQRAVCVICLPLVLPQTLAKSSQ